MIHNLVEKIKLQTGDVMTTLKVRESIKVKDVFSAQAASKTPDGKLDADRYTAEMIARMTGIAYEDVLEMDVRDYDALDTKVAEIRFPKAVSAAAPSGSTPSNESKP